MTSNSKLQRTGFVLAAVLALTVTAALADFDTAMNQFKAGKYLEAAAEFQTLVDQSPDYADGYAMLGICFLKTSKPADAEKNFARAIELKGDVFRYHYNLANAYQLRQQWGKVVSTLNAAEKLAGPQEKPLLHKLRGFSLAAQKKWPEAIEDLEKAPKDGPTLTQLGKAYFTLGESEKAVSYLRQALREDPTDSESHQLMAESLLTMGARATDAAAKAKHYGDALVEAQAFAKAKPSSSDARYLVGRAALGAQDFKLATQEFTKVIDLSPNNCNAMANLGKAFIALSDWDNAVASLDNATTCKPGMGLAWEGKGFALQKQKKYDAALAAYEKALQLEPSSSVARSGVNSCKQNIDVIAHNDSVAVEEAAQAQRILEEEQRIKDEQAKVDEWKQKQDDD